ncbi:hypothetical protein AB3X92_28955 [Paraburkholderia sp. BR14317]|uniref:hypothetical protein n=1 Tax=Paraburkholderia sp. BR14317 TaxID=3237004 RepID=UPI0034CEF00E
MRARNSTRGARRRSAQVAAALCGLLAASVTAGVAAQQVTNPGDVIVERDITPRSAFDNVPKSQDPVLVRATTFPKNSFDPAMATLVTDTDLTNAHGSSGVNANGAMMVNQSAGVGNVQRNTALISSGAIGVVAVSDGELSAAAAQNGGQGQMAQAGGIREVRIDNAAFRNATGLVQVNQTAGAGNATANSFVLRPPAGTLF